MNKNAGVRASVVQHDRIFVFGIGIGKKIEKFSNFKQIRWSKILKKNEKKSFLHTLKP